MERGIVDWLNFFVHSAYSGLKRFGKKRSKFQSKNFDFKASNLFPPFQLSKKKAFQIGAIQNYVPTKTKLD